MLWSLWTTRNNLIFKNIDNFSINSLYFSIFYLLSYWIGSSFPITTGSSCGALNDIGASVQGRVICTMVQLGATGTNIHTNSGNIMVQLDGSGTNTGSISIGHTTEQLSDENLLE
jgi:hypothetical protein